MSVQLNYLINRISSGRLYSDLYYNGKNLKVVLEPPSVELKFEAEEVYMDIFYDATLFGLFSLDECVDLAKQHEIWSDEKEETLKKIPKDIEAMKHLIYQEFDNVQTRERIRCNLYAAEAAQTKLMREKYIYESFSAEAVARLFRNQYLISKTAFLVRSHKTLYKLCQDDLFISSLLNTINSASIEEKTFRLLAKNDPWRTIWSASKGMPFGKVASAMTEEQRYLVCWSKFYDSIQEAVDKPKKEIIEDDDAVDGWLIEQSLGDKTKEKEVIKNEKIAKASEVFIRSKDSAKTEDEKRLFKDLSKEDIESMNTKSGRSIKQQRDRKIQEMGNVAASNLPDIKNEIIMEQNKARFKRRK